MSLGLLPDVVPSYNRHLEYGTRTSVRAIEACIAARFRLMEGKFTVSTSIVLLVLAAGWCCYLTMWWKDARKTAQSRSDRIDSFSSGMGSLGGSASRSIAGPTLRPVEFKPRSSGAAARRRREVFTALAGLAVLTLLASFVLGLVAIAAHLLVDAALVAYGYAVVQRRNLAAEREIKVQMLYPEGVTPLHAQPRTVNA